MADQTSKLSIVIDSRKAKTDLDAVDKSLKSVENQGDKTGKATKSLSDKFNEFKDSATGAKGSLSGFDGSVNGAANSLKGLNPLLGSAAIGIAAVTGAAVGALGALTGMAVVYANNAKEISNFAAVADTGVVEFQRLAVAAQQVGLSSEKVSDQLKDFNEKLGEFILTGKGEATDAFELLQEHAKMSGEEIKRFALEMQKASGAEAMQMYVNAMQKAGVSSEQLSFLTENMANDFTKLLPIFADNGAAIEAWGDAAERAGAIMDEAAIAKSQELQTQVALLELQLKGMSNSILSAVVPALVDIADAFFQDSEQGSTFKSIGEALATTLKVLASTAVVVSNAFFLVGDAIGAGAAAMKAFLSGDFAGAADIVKQNYNNAVDSVADSMQKIDKIFTGGTSDKIKKLQIDPVKKNGAGIAKGVDDFIKGEQKKTKAAKSEADKRAREAERLAKEIARIEYEYSSDEQKRKIKLNEEIKKLEEKGMTQYIPVAKARYEQEEKLIKMKFDYDLVQHKLTEEQKLGYSIKIKEQEILADKGLTTEQRNLRLQALKSIFVEELKYMKLAKEHRIFEAESYQYNEMERIRKRYEFEREQIKLNANLSKEERDALLNASHIGQSQEESRGRDNALGNLQSMTHEMQGTSDFARLEEQLEQRKQILQEAKDWEIISEEDRVKRLLEVEEAYQQSKRDLTLSSTEQIFGSMASMFNKDDDRQKKYYKAMITMEKGAAIARSMIAIQAGIAQAASQPFPANLAAMVTVASQTASIITNLKAIKADGFAEGGYTGNGGKYDVAGLVHKGEVVFSKADVARNGGVQAVESMRKGESSGANIVVQPNVIINIPEGMGATRNVSSDGTITIDVIDGWNQTLLANPNSKTRKGLAQNTTAGARR